MPDSEFRTKALALLARNIKQVERSLNEIDYETVIDLNTERIIRSIAVLTGIMATLITMLQAEEEKD